MNGKKTSKNNVTSSESYQSVTLPLYLANLKALCEKATPGPWTAFDPDVGEDEGIWIKTAEGSIASVRRGCDEVGPREQNIPDADFIAASRTALPTLIAQLEVAIKALEFECGNRCAAQNPCNAREALAEIEGMGK